LPLTTPIWAAPSGPKGFAISEQLGVPGVVAPAGLAKLEQLAPFAEAAGLMSGTVLRAGEDHTSPRVIDAIGPTYASMFHNIFEFAPDALAGMPGGADWRARIEAERPEGQRHIAVHEGHLCCVTERDQPLVEAAGPALLQSGWVGNAASIAGR